MPTTVGQHAVAAFTNPSNGDPLDATVVKSNDNTLRTSYVNHDADTGIHVQSSLLSARPAAGVAGRKWMTTDSGAVKLWYDTGSVWEEIEPTSADTAIKLSSARTFALTGDVTGSVSSDLTSGASIASTYAGTVPVAKGGTGLTAAPTNGQIPIGNGTGYTLATLTAGTNVTITNSAGSVTIASTGALAGTGTTNTVPRYTASATLGDSGITDNGTTIALTRSALTLGTVAYTVPGSQGAANTVLTNNGSGTLSWASSVTGTGTNGRGARFSGTSTIADGAIRDDGTLVAVAGAVEAGVAFKVHGDIKTTGDMSVGDDLTVVGNNLNINGVTYTWPSSATEGVLKRASNGTLFWGPAIPPQDLQTFNANGTWTKPSFGNTALIEVWGAGGSGARDTTNASGGGGGGYSYRIVPTGSLNATESITVGAGGVGVSVNGAGNNGGTSDFAGGGTKEVVAYGGSGGSNSATQVALGGTARRIGSVISTTLGFGHLEHADRMFNGGWSSAASLGTIPASLYDAVYGGGGGASTVNNVNSFVVFGGRGGLANTAGSAPGGGGGYATSGTSGAGAAGRVVVTVW
jgi:hypothetical protein